MADLAAVVATFLFFLIAIAYTAGCDSLGGIGKQASNKGGK
jgi:hypothetical protein